MQSENLSTTEQLGLPLPRELTEVDLASIRRQPNFTKALRLCVDLAGYESDKQVYMEMGIDSGHWARIFKADASAHFPHEKLVRFMTDICGNVAPLLWLIHECGFDPSSLRRYQTDVEAENEELKARVEKLENEKAIIANWMRATK
ncbi:MAG: hypothetical protein NXH95_13550 [Pseudomonadaceae bacterium]|nr:hypothetical protein [Pseudomonadaceae bacterium]